MNIQLKAHREMFYGNFLRPVVSMVITGLKPHHGNCNSIAIPYRLQRTQQNKDSSLGKIISHGGSANSMSGGVENRGSESSGYMDHKNSGINPVTPDKQEIVAGFGLSRWSRPITSNILGSI